MELLKEIAFSPSQSTNLIGAVMGLSYAAANMGLPMPETTAELFSLLATIRLTTQQNDAFPFVYTPKKKGKK